MRLPKPINLIFASNSFVIENGNVLMIPVSALDGYRAYMRVYFDQCI